MAEVDARVEEDAKVEDIVVVVDVDVVAEEEGVEVDIVINHINLPVVTEHS